MDLYLKSLELGEARTAKALHKLAVRRHLTHLVLAFFDEIDERTTLSIVEARRTLFEEFGGESSTEHAAHVEKLCAALESAGNKNENESGGNAGDTALLGEEMHLRREDLMNLLEEIEHMEVAHRARLSHDASKRHERRKTLFGSGRERSGSSFLRSTERRLSMNVDRAALRANSVMNLDDAVDEEEAEHEGAKEEEEEAARCHKYAPCVSTHSSVCCCCCRGYANGPRNFFSFATHSEKRMCCQCTRSEFVLHLVVHTSFCVFCIVSAAVWMSIEHVEKQLDDGTPIYTSNGKIARTTWSFSDAFYFTLMTISTVGFGK